MNRESSRYVTAPACEALEARKLLAAASHTSPAMTARLEVIAASAHLRADVNRLAADVRTMQAGSHVTQAEYLAVFTDVENDQQTSIAPAGTETLGSAAYDIIYRVDYSIIEANYTPQEWAEKKAALAGDFAALGYAVSPSALDQTMADLQAMALSANVSGAENQKYWADEKTVITDLNADPAASYMMDPFYTFEQKYPGFVKHAHVVGYGPIGSVLPLPTLQGVEWNTYLD